MEESFLASPTVFLASVSQYLLYFQKYFSLLLEHVFYFEAQKQIKIVEKLFYFLSGYQLWQISLL